MMSEHDELVLRRDTLRKGIEDARQVLLERKQERDQALRDLLLERDELREKQQKLEAELESLEGDLFEITERQSAAREEARRARAHAASLVKDDE
jgi:chromosome segregation ATPase